MRHVVSVFTVVLIALGLAACGGGDDSKSSDKSQNKGYDRQDPKAAGCDTPAPVDVPGSTVPVKLPNGKVLGQLVLRRSTSCQTMWGRIGGLPKKPTGYDVMHVNVTRPSDGATAPFQTKDVYIAVFGDMLTYRPGCVYAEAHVVRKGKQGPVAKTPCKKE